MATREQAEQVVNNPAFTAAFESLREEYVDVILHGTVNSEDLLKARMKYDALILVHLELLARLNDITSAERR
jgi:hypothetical protein